MDTALITKIAFIHLEPLPRSLLLTFIFPTSDVGTVTGTTVASPSWESFMLVMTPSADLVTVTTVEEKSSSSWCLKLVHRSSNFTDCRERETQDGG